MQHSYGVVSCTHCKDCGEEIPEARRRVVPGVKFCIECQDDHMVVRKVKMLTKML
jgi:phage/conjugal plasmid C-4 type zinc finger TraR family protein